MSLLEKIQLSEDTSKVTKGSEKALELRENEGQEKRKLPK